MFATTKKALFATLTTLLIASVASADYYSVRPSGTHYSNSGDRAGYRSTSVYTPAPRFFAPAAPAAVAVAPAACPAPAVAATPAAAPRIVIPAVPTVPTTVVTPSH